MGDIATKRTAGETAGKSRRLRAGLRVLAFLCFVLAALSPDPALARRAALVIGNGQYPNANFLKNPANDAQLIADSARKAGFDVVMLVDLNMRDFEAALRDFRTKADGAEVAMIYFAGHGIENAGKNWLLPVDAKLLESRDLRFEAIELDSLLETLQGAHLRMVVLDACRNNPLRQQLAQWNESGVERPRPDRDRRRDGHVCGRRRASRDRRRRCQFALRPLARSPAGRAGPVDPPARIGRSRGCDECHGRPAAALDQHEHRQRGIFPRRRFESPARRGGAPTHSTPTRRTSRQPTG